MKDRTPRYPGRVKLTPVAGQTNTYDMVRADSPVEPGTPINKQTLLTDETAYLLELKQECPTPDDAFSHIARNFTGDGGINVNLLEEMIHMKYCKILEAETASINPWLAAGAAKCVCDSYNGTYRYYARIVANTSAFEVRRENKSTGQITDYSIEMPAIASFYRTTSYTTTWVARIVPVVVRHSNHMIFMYMIGYSYNNNYKGVVGTICYDTVGNRLVAVGQTSTTSSNFPSTGVGNYNYLNTGSYQGVNLANAVRTNSGYIRFYPGYTSSAGYVYSMQEGGSSFTAYSSTYARVSSDYSSYPVYVALYKDDHAHLVGYSSIYHVQFSGTSATTLTTTNTNTMTYYSNMMSIGSNNNNGGYTRKLVYSSDGLTADFYFNYSSSPYTICKWRTTATAAAPTHSVVDANKVAESEYWTMLTYSGLRIVSMENTTMTDRKSGKFIQSFPFAAISGTSCYRAYKQIGTNDPLPIVYQLNCSAGYVLNRNEDGIILWNEYGQIWDLKFFTQGQIPYKTWTCPEDGTYKILLVGGGAAGGDAYGGGAGYMHIATVKLLEDDVVQYYVGKGGVYNATVPPEAMATYFGDLAAMPGNGNKGGADGASTPSGGGGGGYNLVIYGGQGQNYNSATQTFSVSSSSSTITTNGVVSSKDRNGGQSANSGACTSGDGYGAGGGYRQDGKDGVIVIIR
jgi:hypothetical protein